MLFNRSWNGDPDTGNLELDYNPLNVILLASLCTRDWVLLYLMVSIRRSDLRSWVCTTPCTMSLSPSGGHAHLPASLPMRETVQHYSHIQRRLGVNRNQLEHRLFEWLTIFGARMIQNKEQEPLIEEKNVNNQSGYQEHVGKKKKTSRDKNQRITEKTTRFISIRD